jgi:hypothetical protein
MWDRRGRKLFRMFSCVWGLESGGWRCGGLEELGEEELASLIRCLRLGDFFICLGLYGYATGRTIRAWMIGGCTPSRSGGRSNRYLPPLPSPPLPTPYLRLGLIHLYRPSPPMELATMSSKSDAPPPSNPRLVASILIPVASPFSHMIIHYNTHHHQVHRLDPYPDPT